MAEMALPRPLRARAPMEWLRSYLDPAARKGVDIDSLLRRYAPRLDHGGAEVALSSLEQLAVILEAQIGLRDESHGYSKTPVPIGYNSLMLRTMMSAKTVSEALELVSRYLWMTEGPLRLDVRHTSTDATIYCRLAEPESEGARYEELWAYWLGVSLSWMAGVWIRPSAVLTSSPEHPCLNGRHWLSHAPVLLAPATGLRLTSKQLGTPLLQRSDSHPVWSCLKFLMERESARVGTGEYKQADGGALFQGRRVMQMGELCTDLSISASTLRRRLNAQGLNFRSLKKEALIAKICERIVVSGDTGEQLADHMGFAEARSLRRMIKAATGLTLQELRASLARGGSVFEMSALQSRMLHFARVVDGQMGLHRRAPADQPQPRVRLSAALPLRVAGPSRAKGLEHA